MTTCALLSQRHDVTLFEANDYIGGHTHSVCVNLDDEQHVIDTGFIVFNDRTYPNFCCLLDQLGVQSQPTEMSFSVRCDATGLEYNGTSLNGVFAQRRNLVRPRFCRMLWDILRFNRDATAQVEGLPEDATVKEFLDRHRYSCQFARHYLLPMGAAIWSCPVEVFEQFPIRFIVAFYRNHGLLQIRDRPVWRTIVGSSREYVDQLTAQFRDCIRLRCPVKTVSRIGGRVCVVSASGIDHFDEVVFACHSDQALRLLDDSDEQEREILEAFPFSSNRIVLHTDTSVLPRLKRAWASWNYRLPTSGATRPTLTYCMNILQRLKSRHTFCVTLNQEESIDPACILGEYDYSHPVFTTRRSAAQRRHVEFIRRRQTSFCGAYWGNGFHEDGVNSALAVCEAFGIDPKLWSVVGNNHVSQPRELVHAQ